MTTTHVRTAETNVPAIGQLPPLPPGHVIGSGRERVGPRVGHVGVGGTSEDESLADLQLEPDFAYPGLRLDVPDQGFDRG